MKLVQYFLIFFIFHKSFSFAKVDWDEELSEFKATDKNYDQLWNKYKKEFKKIYKNNSDNKKHKDIFIKNVKNIIEHNKKFKEKKVTYKRGINQFTDMLRNQLRKIHKVRILKDPFLKIKPAENNISYMSFGYLPKNFNWIKKGFDPIVYDQGECSSCYAFSAIGSIEGNYFKRYKRNIKMSEQEIIDCGDKYNLYGCEGGQMSDVFRFSENIGISLLKYYPYVGKKVGCYQKKKGPRIEVKDFYTIFPGDEYGIQYAIVNYGPVAVAVDIRAPSFDSYEGGIYSEPQCSSDINDLAHTLLAVGYGTSGKKKYWILKNQWGYSWGDGGYMKMLRNGKNHCGIATAAVYAANVEEL